MISTAADLAGAAILGMLVFKLLGDTLVLTVFGRTNIRIVAAAFAMVTDDTATTTATIPCHHSHRHRHQELRAPFGVLAARRSLVTERVSIPLSRQRYARPSARLS